MAALLNVNWKKKTNWTMCSSRIKYLSAKATKDTLKFLKLIYFSVNTFKKAIVWKEFDQFINWLTSQISHGFQWKHMPTQKLRVYLSLFRCAMCHIGYKERKSALEAPMLYLGKQTHAKIITAPVRERSAKCCGSWWGREVTARCAQESSKLHK